VGSFGPERLFFGGFFARMDFSGGLFGVSQDESLRTRKEKVVWSKKIKAAKLAWRWTYQSSPFLAFVVVVLSIFGGLLSIIDPYIFKLVIDYLVGGTHFPQAAQLGIGFGGVLVIYGATRTLQNIFFDVLAFIKRLHIFRIEKLAFSEMMKAVSSLDAVYFEDPEYYNTISKANDSIWRSVEVFWGIMFALRPFVGIGVIATALLAYNPLIILLVLIGAIPSVIFAFTGINYLWSAFAESSPIRRHASYYKWLMTDQPEAVREIRLFGLRSYFLEKFRKLFDSFIKNQDRAVIKYITWYVVIGLAEGISSVFAAFVVVESFIRGELTIGQLTFLWSLLFQFAAQIRWFVGAINQLISDATFLTPVVDVLEFKPQVLESPRAKKFPSKIKKGIEFKNVTFYYPRSKRPALKNINLKIEPAENIALVGENGSGKTTLIKLLCRFYDVSSGEILIDGRNIKEYSFETLYNNIGVIFQDFVKYEALVKENIGFGRLANIKKKSKITEAAKKSGAWNFIKEFKNKLETPLGKRIREEGVELSTGQWQKIALARAFFRDAQILILDEPTAAIDAKAEYQLFRRFQELTKNKITFLISHRFSTVRMADKIIVMRKGKISEQGSHQALLKKGGDYYRLFTLQAGGYK